MKRISMTLAAVAVAAASLTGCSTGGGEAGWCDKARSTFSSWVPESDGGTAAMNALPSDPDIQHAAIQLQNDAPETLKPGMGLVVMDAMHGEAALLVHDENNVLSQCQTDAS